MKTVSYTHLDVYKRQVKKVGKDTVTYKITAPDFSKYFTEMKKSKVTEENIESFTCLLYTSRARKKKQAPERSDTCSGSQ